MKNYTANSTITFGIDLLKQLFSPPANICISPLSISTCLQLALMGAKDKTYDEMFRVLGSGAPDRNALADDCHKLVDYVTWMPEISAYEGPGGTLKLEIANSLWTHNSFRLRPEYVEELKVKYDAVCRNLDFGDPESLVTINSWVEKKTHNKISNIISELDPLLYMLLINCAYFKARWKNEFDKDATGPDSFYNEEGSKSEVLMMHLHLETQYYGNDQVQIIDLPYTDNRFGMYIILPSRDLAQFLAGLDAQKWKGLLNQLSMRRGNLALPRFKIEFSSTLNGMLEKMGMHEAFQQTADFSGIYESADGAPPAFWIGKVLHKTFINVDEEGTEAAAATAIAVFGAAPMEPPPPFTMRVDRPFIFVLAERQSGAILFLGTVTNPTPA